MVMGSSVAYYTVIFSKTIALLAMEPPISLDNEYIRNEKVMVLVYKRFEGSSCFSKKFIFQVKVLRSIQKLEPSDVILGQYKASTKDKVGIYLNSLTCISVITLRVL